MTTPLLLSVLLGTAAGGFVNGVSGFAFGLVSMGVWAWVLEPQLAAPMVVFGALVAQAAGLRYVWRGLRWRLLLPLLVGGIAGVPIGVRLLGVIEPHHFRAVVGSVLVIYPAFLLLAQRPRRVTAGGGLADGAAGFAGGVMGGLAGLNGPVPVLWCSLRGWEREVQRGVFQTYAVVTQSLTLASYALDGTVTRAMLPIFALMLPIILLSTWLGVQLYRRISERQFRRIVLLLLLLSGATLLVGSV